MEDQETTFPLWSLKSWTGGEKHLSPGGKDYQNKGVQNHESGQEELER